MVLFLRNNPCDLAKANGAKWYEMRGQALMIMKDMIRKMDFLVSYERNLSWSIILIIIYSLRSSFSLQNAPEGTRGQASNQPC